MFNIFITGATGFIGKALVKKLTGWPVQQGTRAGFLGWEKQLKGMEVVVHLAGRVHHMRDSADDPMTAYRAVNVENTLSLAHNASVVGVKRFVFISSVKVNGECTQLGKPFTEVDVPKPQDDYGLSKQEAEDGLRQISSDTGMEVVIIRSPLVYGPGVKGNFATLMKAVKRGRLLPLGAVHNRRSLVGLDNLIDFIVTCITHSKAANQTFFVNDFRDISTSELIRLMAKAGGARPHLLPVPVWALQLAGSFLGRDIEVQRLCSNLQVDTSKAFNLLGWTPPLTLEEGLRRAME